MSQKTVQICFFCQNFVKFTPILIIFGRKVAKRLKLYEMHSFSTSPNSLHHTTVLNADVPKCYRTLKVDISKKLSNDLAHNKLKCGLFSRIISSCKARLKNCQKLSEFVYKLPKNWMVPRNVLFAASYGWVQKTWSRICGLTGICHCTEVEGIKYAVVCYFQCRMFDPTNFLNHVAPSIELMMQIRAIRY